MDQTQASQLLGVKGGSGEREALEFALTQIESPDWCRSILALRPNPHESHVPDLWERLAQQMAYFEGRRAELGPKLSGEEHREFLRWARRHGWRRKIPCLGTERLRLREWRNEDREPFRALNQDPEVMEFFPHPLAASESDAMVDRCVENFIRYGFGPWAVEEKATGNFLGFIGLIVPTFQAHFTPCVEIGWRLVRSSWGKGYAVEGASAALAFSFSVLRLEEVVSLTSPLNRRSWAVMERLGMRRDLRDDFLHPRLAPEHRLAPHLLYRIRSFAKPASVYWDY